MTKTKARAFKVRTYESRHKCNCGAYYMETDYGTHKTIKCEACVARAERNANRQLTEREKKIRAQIEYLEQFM